MAIKGVGGIGRFWRSLALGAGLATARFPVSAFLVLVISAIANLEVAGIGFLKDTDLVWLVSALSAALAASVAVRLAGESRGWRQGSLQAAPLLAAALAGLLVWYAEPLSILAPPLLAALVLSIPLAPYVLRPDDERFWVFALWTGVGVTLAFVSVLLFVLGVSAILEMIRYLFEIGLSSDAYEHIYVTALTMVGPLFALGRIPRDFDETIAVGADDRLAAGVRFLFDWVGAPLALATAVVLHLYAAKIGVGGELPKNEIGWIVTFYAMLVLSFRVAVEPFVDGGAVTTRLFGRLWAPMLVVPLALLVYAAALRIGAEGFTLERYYLALGALAAAAIVAAQLLPRFRDDIRFIAGVPLALLALSSFGPWGATDVVGRSQAGMVRSAFGEELIDAAALDVDQRAVLRSRIDALDEVDELGRILPLFAEPARTAIAARTADRPDDIASVVVDVLGLGYGGAEVPGEFMTGFAATKPVPLEAGGYDLIVAEQSVVPGETSVPPRATAPPGDPAEVELFLDGQDLVVRFAGTEDRFAWGDGLARLTSDETDTRRIAPPVVNLASASGRTARARITWASLVRPDMRPVALTMTLLLERSQWPAAGAASLGGGGDVPGGQALGDGEAGGGQPEPGGAVGEGPR